jgi:hypothetical protein
MVGNGCPADAVVGKVGLLIIGDSLSDDMRLKVDVAKMGEETRFCVSRWVSRRWGVWLGMRVGGIWLEVVSCR